jgi:hypothetical protein
LLLRAGRLHLDSKKHFETIIDTKIEFLKQTIFKNVMLTFLKLAQMNTFLKAAYSLLLLRGFCYCYEAERADAGLYMIPEPPGKTVFRIGGWGPGEKESQFMERYKPIFQDYLTEVVGTQYSPPITFEFITTDWGSDETKTSHVLIEEGTIDFTCESTRTS